MLLGSLERDDFLTQQPVPTEFCYLARCSFMLFRLEVTCFELDGHITIAQELQ